jgi:hypothetical protein
LLLRLPPAGGRPLNQSLNSLPYLCDGQRDLIRYCHRPGPRAYGWARGRARVWLNRHTVTLFWKAARRAWAGARAGGFKTEPRFCAVAAESPFSSFREVAYGRVCKVCGVLSRRRPAGCKRISIAFTKCHRRKLPHRSRQLDSLIMKALLNQQAYSLSDTDG